MLCRSCHIRVLFVTSAKCYRRAALSPPALFLRYIGLAMRHAFARRIGSAPGARAHTCTTRATSHETLMVITRPDVSGGRDHPVSHSSQPDKFVSSLPESSSLTSHAIARATNKTIEQISGRQQQLLVAYQGVPGAYSEGAARTACPEHEPLPCSQFEVAFQALSQWMSDRACLPIENSLGGSIHAVYDLLLRYNLHIVGEKSIAVNHCLMANKGVKIGELKRVMSHAQALAQTDQYLRDLNVVKEAVDDTAGAAQLVARNNWKDVGAIASARAAELYGLEILAEGIQDMEDNVTRFIILSRDPLVQTAQIERGSALFKTSIVFSLAEGPGNLFKALSCFALRDLDLTKIESRPMRSNPIVVSKVQDSRRLNYLFYVDVLGSVADPNCQNALKHLQEFAPFLRVLGSYPVDREFLAT